MSRGEHVERFLRLCAALTRAILEMPRGEEAPSDEMLRGLQDALNELQEWFGRAYDARWSA